jgi:hypothetical protein
MCFSYALNDLNPWDFTAMNPVGCDFCILVHIQFFLPDQLTLIHHIVFKLNYDFYM